MTYRAAAALQGAVYQRLSTWAGLNGVAVVDAVPPGTGTGTFILLGPEQANDESDGSGAGVAHMFVVSIISDAAGFMAAKAAGAKSWHPVYLGVSADPFGALLDHGWPSGVFYGSALTLAIGVLSAAAVGSGIHRQRTAAAKPAV